MLIAQVFPVVSVYTLPGGQHAYRGNIINFPQDVQEFVTRLPHDPSSLNLLIVRRYSEDGSNFRDFHVRRRKVMRALQWLKVNNKLYREIDIDDEILQSLPEDGSITEKLPQYTDDRTPGSEEGPNGEDDDENEENAFNSQTFVPSLLNRLSENIAINEILNRANHNQENLKIDWPHNEISPVDEFNTPGYIARAFPTLYPWGIADLNEPREKEIKAAEYFKHLLVYKDGRFARHRRWRYFALNSLMRWRALSEGRVFVKQNLEKGQLTVSELLDLMKDDAHIVDKILRYGEGLRGTRQYWMRRRAELLDLVK